MICTGLLLEKEIAFSKLELQIDKINQETNVFWFGGLNQVLKMNKVANKSQSLYTFTYSYNSSFAYSVSVGFQKISIPLPCMEGFSL